MRYRKVSKKLIVYTRNQYPFLCQQYEEFGYRIFSISAYISNEVREYSGKKVIDISPLGDLSNSENGLLLTIEQLISKFDIQTVFISDNETDSYKYSLRYFFTEFEKYETELVDGEHENLAKPIVLSLRKVTDLDEKTLSSVYGKFISDLHGHQRFKEDFIREINSFRVFNKIEEHKILSIFVMGESGVGKTQIARSFYMSMGGKKRLAKINFGNYSSMDSLNSLIGSPRGYIGSDGGELFNRLHDTDIGIILIDEFEKATTPVFNYFLDLLETGRATNSLGEEVDLDGFIIVFTSNISEQDYKSKFSPELRSRFDYISKLMLLTKEEKNFYVKNRCQKIVEKYNAVCKTKLSYEDFYSILQTIDLDKYYNMRQLNGVINKKFVEYIYNVNEE